MITILLLIIQFNIIILYIFQKIYNSFLKIAKFIIHTKKLQNFIINTKKLQNF